MPLSGAPDTERAETEDRALDDTPGGPILKNGQ